MIATKMILNHKNALKSGILHLNIIDLTWFTLNSCQTMMVYFQIGLDSFLIWSAICIQKVSIKVSFLYIATRIISKMISDKYIWWHHSYLITMKLYWQKSIGRHEIENKTIMIQSNYLKFEVNSICLMISFAITYDDKQMKYVGYVLFDNMLFNYQINTAIAI